MKLCLRQSGDNEMFAHIDSHKKCIPVSRYQTCQLLWFERSLLCSAEAYYDQTKITMLSIKKYVIKRISERIIFYSLMRERKREPSDQVKASQSICDLHHELSMLLIA